MTSRASWALDADVEAIVAGRHHNPFSVLGPHACLGGAMLRVFAPGARRLSAVFADGERATLEARGEQGFFEGLVAHRPQPGTGQCRAGGRALAGRAGMRHVVIVLAAALLLAGCGKKGPPQPPGPPDQITWPHSYPKPPVSP